MQSIIQYKTKGTHTHTPLIFHHTAPNTFHFDAEKGFVSCDLKQNTTILNNPTFGAMRTANYHKYPLWLEKYIVIMLFACVLGFSIL
jgi:hypothetical protein